DAAGLDVRLHLHDSVSLGLGSRAPHDGAGLHTGLDLHPRTSSVAAARVASDRPPRTRGGNPVTRPARPALVLPYQGHRQKAPEPATPARKIFREPQVGHEAARGAVHGTWASCAGGVSRRMSTARKRSRLTAP